MVNRVRKRFNPSWESRPSGTPGVALLATVPKMFQPLMGEPSLWNIDLHGDTTPLLWFQPLMGEPSLWNRGIPLVEIIRGLVSTPHGRAVPLEHSPLR